jgi:mycofactocin precursor
MESAPNEPATPTPEDEDAELVVEDLLVEDVSIDGMCGVY